MLLHVAREQRNVFVDARERAPLGASRNMYLNAEGEADRSNSVNGALAAAIPGLPAGLVHLSRNYGRLSLEQSFGPALRLAREGWRFSQKNATMLGSRKAVLATNPTATALFLRDGEIPEVGATLRNPDYAATLERIARHGADGFYRGELAQRLVAGVRAGGGIWSEEDLASYAVKEREPLRIQHGEWTVITAPPPSSGGIALAEMMNILSGYDYAVLETVPRAHLLTEAMRRAYRDRATHMGDPDFVQMPLDLLASPDYAAGLRAGIHPARATPSDLIPGVRSSPAGADTSHFSIVDREGNLVAVTQSVNLPYGSTFSVAGTGFLLNNEMDDFSVKPGVPNAYGLIGDDANAIAPGKRPLSSMTPTMLLGRDRVALVGTPGGSRIISTVLLGLIELMQGSGAQAAVDLPRFHHQYLPDAISAEAGAFNAEQVAALQAMGHTVNAGERTWGNMQVVLWNRNDGTVEAGSDPRWKGVGKGATTDVEAIYR
jgi:gamma-glutamyltranspeptidase/glutathione hydrolase